ncbi:MAG: cysteine--tRNA ligase [Candidatus Omnitrophica bacterium]|nr:cysteine--tRNA ligase [Candidatus Omnitrophota bacterium]
MALRFTDTLTGRKQELVPLTPGRVGLYVCGVTVYDDCHIGHARGAVIFDVLRRYLEHRGLRVTHVRNITDVDDKIIDRARREAGEGGDLQAAARAVAARYTDSFRADFSRLGLLAPHHEPKATEYVRPMVALIGELLRVGAAYEAPDGVYLWVRKLPPGAGYRYGILSHQRIDQLMEGEKEAGEGKRDPVDFALWKKAKAGEPAWDSPWGPGRPGWHIECTTMSSEILGPAFDIHGGGQDLVFPHHENELAQARGLGRKFARVWIHNGLLTVNGQKMAKSLGNIVRIEDALARHPADVLRLFFLGSHYRSPVDFTWERLEEAAHAYDRLTAFLAHSATKNEAGSSPAEAEAKFHEAMDDDLNTPKALACLYTLVPHPSPAAGEVVRRMGGVLGLFQRQEALEPEVARWVRERDEARSKKDFATADRIRRELVEQGWVVEDTSGKTVVRRRA